MSSHSDSRQPFRGSEVGQKWVLLVLYFGQGWVLDNPVESAYNREQSRRRWIYIPTQVSDKSGYSLEAVHAAVLFGR